MSDRTVTVIEARPTTIAARVSALWQFRGFYPFLFKEITSRKFQGTLLSYWWLLIRPLLTTGVAVVMFTFIIPTQVHGMPYAIFYFSGFVVWNLFHAILIYLPRTMRWMQSIMRRTYFPRMLVPLAGFGAPLIETALVTGIFGLVLIYFKLSTGMLYLNASWALLWLLPCLLGALLLGVAIGMVASVIALFVRDVVYSIRYFAQVLMLATPVFYPASLIPEKYRWLLYILNPMAQIVETSRYAIAGAGDFNPLFLAISFVTIALVLVVSVGFFLRVERFLGDEM